MGSCLDCHNKLRKGDGPELRVVKALGDTAIVSVHCHDDLGLAVANSLAAVKAGARQIECTVNGIGDFASSIILGLLWTNFGTAPAFAYSAILFVCGSLMVLRISQGARPG